MIITKKYEPCSTCKYFKKVSYNDAGFIDGGYCKAIVYFDKNTKTIKFPKVVYVKNTNTCQYYQPNLFERIRRFFAMIYYKWKYPELFKKD